MSISMRCREQDSRLTESQQGRNPRVSSHVSQGHMLGTHVSGEGDCGFRAPSLFTRENSTFRAMWPTRL